MKRLAAALLIALVAGVSAADSWVPVTPMPAARSYAGGAAPWGATLFVAGGISGTAYLSTFQVYDAQADVWTNLAPLIVSRAGAVVCGIGASVYAVSGTAGETGLAVTEAYDPATDSWITRAPMKGPRRWAAGAASGGKLYVTGGVVSGTILNTMEAYDPYTNTWVTRAPMPTPRFLHSAVAVGGKIYFIGGFSALVGGVNLTNVQIIYVNTVEIYDPATNTWTMGAPMPTPRGAAGAASPGNGMIYVAGGMAVTGATDACERYNPVANRWDTRAPIQLPGPGTGRLGLVVAAPLSGTVLLAVGGESTTRASYDNGGTWRTSGTVYAFAEKYERDPAALAATMTVTPPRVAVGSSATVFLDFTNTGDATVGGITGEIEIIAGAGGVAVSGGPASATWFTGTLTPGTSGRFAWVVDATAAGEARLSGTATGTDAEWGIAAAGSAWNDHPLTTGYPAKLVSTVSLGPLPIVPGGNLTVTFTVTNEGGGTAYNASALIRVSPAGAPVAIVAGPAPTQAVPSPWLSGTVMIGPLSSTTLTWTFSVTGAGYALFTCDAKGTDPIFGTVTTTGLRSTTPSAPAGVATRQGDAGALLTWTANPAHEGVFTYFIYRAPAPGVTPSPVLLAGTTSNTWFDDTGLVNGVRYYYVLTAMNGDGVGPPCPEVAVMPANIPDIPGDVRVACTGTNPLAINPDRGERIQFLVSVPGGSGTMRITVYTLAGEIVREVFHSPLPPGKWILDWDGRNSKGRAVASGGYIAVLEMPDGSRKIRKVAVLR